MKETTENHHEALSKIKLLVRVLQDVVKGQSFDSYADIKEALKCRLARLRIVYSSELVSAAMDRLELGGSAPLVRMPVERRRQAEPDTFIRPVFERREAEQIAEILLARYRAEHPEPR